MNKIGKVICEDISEINKEVNTTNIVNDKCDDLRDIEETIYLNSIPGYVDSVKDALKEDRTKCSVYQKGEKW